MSCILGFPLVAQGPAYRAPWGPAYRIPCSLRGTAYRVPRSLRGPAYRVPRSLRGPAYRVPRSLRDPAYRVPRRSRPSTAGNLVEERRSFSTKQKPPIGVMCSVAMLLQSTSASAPAYSTGHMQLNWKWEYCVNWIMKSKTAFECLSPWTHCWQAIPDYALAYNNEVSRQLHAA